MTESQEKMPVSLCLIVRNEADNLKRCVEYIGEAVSEIILLDTGSTDGTPETAKELGACVFHYDWDENFSNARNTLLKKAKYGWVLWIDGDEFYPPGLVNEIREKITSDDTYPGYYFPRKNFYFGSWLRYGGNYPDYQLKLFKRSAAFQFTSRLHEKIELNGKAGYVSNACEHYPYPTIDSYFHKFGFYTTLEAKKMLDSGMSVSFMNSLMWLFLRPASRFFKRYVLKAGFLNGFPGLFAAVFDAAGYIVRYVKLWELQKRNNSI